VRLLENPKPSSRAESITTTRPDEKFFVENICHMTQKNCLIFTNPCYATFLHVTLRRKKSKEGGESFDQQSIHRPF
jgi:hypothetical protein